MPKKLSAVVGFLLLWSKYDTACYPYFRIAAHHLAN